ncbi:MULTISPECIES: inorganic pyrophosphatase [Pediococcus]|uniref:inorganic pyrophosphatase n=1 Tax=Pediococcus TaxID=1253 RepID=UPI0007093977|nr:MULTISPECIES: inorganic pyrophosphatase [Pediococcus]MCT3026891.1 inorganic pyrophosphatase [Pediococcus parvulus]MCT3028164.1 inorganic pyrophosphatase [Pediococcus parvulus]MCT3032044.1 inorganic pyrophosphatase [Pediococcus parvulus]MCT3035438.1 inorganic pyrophosphatase [Pediococcus parvulus]GEL90629.1 inorganic pyrophosphatase [Pediococcus parvulus]
MNKLKLQVTIDRPKGYVDQFGNVYPLNYGYISGIIGGDGEKQDVYVISKNAETPIGTFTGILVAIIHRDDDVETKWVVTSEKEVISEKEIFENTQFLEKHFNSRIEIL